MNNALDTLQAWLDGVNTKNIEKLLSLYNESALLIPTFSNRILNNPSKIQDYFKQVGSKEDLSVTLHENTVNNQDLGNNIFCVSGIYNWKLKVDGELLNFEARFSYVFDLNKTSPILHHHSSQIPRML